MSDTRLVSGRRKSQWTHLAVLGVIFVPWACLSWLSRELIWEYLFWFFEVDTDTFLCFFPWLGFVFSFSFSNIFSKSSANLVSITSTFWDALGGIFRLHVLKIRDKCKSFPIFLFRPRGSTKLKLRLDRNKFWICLFWMFVMIDLRCLNLLLLACNLFCFEKLLFTEMLSWLNFAS